MRQTIEDEAPIVWQTELSGIRERPELPVGPAELVEGDRIQRVQKVRKVQKIWMNLVLQIIRFGLVGGLNTTLDLLIFNAFLLLYPTKDTVMLLAYNSIAYAIGGINSFMLNKYWTFRSRQKTTRQELLRFVITTLLGIGCNDLIIWLISTVSHPLIADERLWANVSKICAIFGTVLISYLGMRLWVFVKPAQAATGE